MLARTRSYTTVGLNAVPVEVEVDAGRGLPALAIVGLPDQAVKEAKERVRTAIINSQFQLPSNRFTVNLAPADLKKEGGVFDLAIALGVLAASHQADPARLASVTVLGELALDGSVRPVPGVLPIALAARASKQRLLVPAPNAAEAAVVAGAEVIPVGSLREAVDVLSGAGSVVPCRVVRQRVTGRVRDDVDFADVKGQAHAKRALDVAVENAHPGRASQCHIESGTTKLELFNPPPSCQPAPRCWLMRGRLNRRFESIQADLGTLVLFPPH